MLRDWLFSQRLPLANIVPYYLFCDIVLLVGAFWMNFHVWIFLVLCAH
jgi:hypothetical protein